MPGDVSPSGWGSDHWLAVVSFWLTVIGLVLAVIALVFVPEFRTWVRKVLRAYWEPSLSGFLMAAIFFVAYWRWHALGLNGALAFSVIVLTLWAAQRFRTWRRYKRYDRGRWEAITKIRYGHLEYPPFLYYGQEDRNPAGLGVTLLNQLLGSPLNGKKIDIKPFGVPRNWNDVLEGLVNGQYDVVATPLFATFDRSKYVAFTAPLCFSNVGLYVREDVAGLTALRNLSSRDLTTDELKAAVQESALKFLCVKGEISRKLAVKYGDRSSIVSEVSGTILPNLFEKMVAQPTPHYALFCESFYAENQEVVKSRAVKNVLPLHGILYPVCFAVRQGDYQLVNLLNIRLLQFNQNGGALPLLAAEWERHQGVEAKNIKQHFVAEWPCKSALPIV